MMRNQEDYTTEMTGTTYKIESGIATITLNRPNQYNTLTKQVILDLMSKLDEIAHDREIKVLIIASNGKAFSTGHDLKDMLKNNNEAYFTDLLGTMFLNDAKNRNPPSTRDSAGSRYCDGSRLSVSRNLRSCGGRRILNFCN